MKPLEIIILVAGFILALASGVSLLYCVALMLGAEAEGVGYSVLKSVGYWPLYTLFLFVLSLYFIAGAEPLAKAIGKKKSDEHKSGLGS